MRAILVALAILALALLAGFFAGHPGAVAIRWQGWSVDTSVGVLAGATLFAAFALAFFLLAARAIIRAPRQWLAARREKRRREGYRALSDGFVALAAGDPREGARLARRAEILLAGAPPSLVLSARAAELEGDEIAAERYWTRMLEEPQTELLGLRGLFRRALGEGDREAARGFARRAKALSARAPWVARSLFDLETREGRWQEAERVLADASAQQVFPAERARHYRGVLLYELSREAEKAGDRRRALTLAASAEAFCRDLAAPAAHHARLLLEQGRAKAAARVVESAWRTAPTPELSRLYGTIFAGEPALQRVKRFERLAAQNPEARESRIALAEAALAAELWGQARHSLETALAAAPPQRFPARAAPVERSRASRGSPLEEGSGGLVDSWPSPGTHGPQSTRGLPNRQLLHETALGALSFADAGIGEESPRPTLRLCLLMARLEEAEYGDSARARDWREKALAAAPDPLYVCGDCGGESLEWDALCPSCGGFDTLSWCTPQRAANPPLRAAVSLPEAAPRGAAFPLPRQAEREGQ